MRRLSDARRRLSSRSETCPGPPRSSIDPCSWAPRAIDDYGFATREGAGWRWRRIGNRRCARWESAATSSAQCSARWGGRQEVGSLTRTSQPTDHRPNPGQGLVNEIEDQPYLIVDGLDGRAHYVKLPPEPTSPRSHGRDVEIRSATQSRASDRTIASIAVDGIYRTERHLELARSGAKAPLDPETFVGGHVRRLEALRRAGCVERLEEGLGEFRRTWWSVDAGLTRIEPAGHHHAAVVLIGDGQSHALGATWLDRQMLEPGTAVPATAWGATLKEAYREREAFLIDQGLARRTDKGVVLARDLLQPASTRNGQDCAAHRARNRTDSSCGRRYLVRIRCLSTSRAAGEWPVRDAG